MGTTLRNPGGGVLGFAIALIAFAFGGALGLPESLRLLVIGAGVLLAVLSAGTTGFGLAALVLGGSVLVSSIALLGANGVGRILQVPPPRSSHRDDTTAARGQRIHLDAVRREIRRSLVEPGIQGRASDLLRSCR